MNEPLTGPMAERLKEMYREWCQEGGIRPFRGDDPWQEDEDQPLDRYSNLASDRPQRWS